MIEHNYASYIWSKNFSRWSHLLSVGCKNRICQLTNKISRFDDRILLWRCRCCCFSFLSMEIQKNPSEVEDMCLVSFRRKFFHRPMGSTYLTCLLFEFLDVGFTNMKKKVLYDKFQRTFQRTLCSNRAHMNDLWLLFSFLIPF